MLSTIFHAVFKTKRISLLLIISVSTLFIIVFMLADLAAQPLTSAGGGNERYVAPTGNDSSNDCTDPAQPCATIQQAINEAAVNDLIKLAKGTYSSLNNQGGLSQIGYIEKALTFQGGYTTTDSFDVSNPISNPTVIDAQEMGRGLVITGSVSVNVENLTILNGDATGLGGGVAAGGCPDAGGGIFVMGSAFELVNSTIMSSTACNGGAFYGEDLSSLMVSESELVGNQAAWYGGGFYIYQSSMILMINTAIHQNIANSVGGGMKHCGGGRLHVGNNIELVNNQIFMNIAADNGGGLCLEGVTAAELKSNQIYSNTRLAGFPGHGGGVFVNGSSVAFENNDIFANSGVDLNNLGANYFGGGVFVANSTVTFTADRLLNNISTHGGGLAVSASTITGTNLAISGNWVREAAEGSGLYIEDSDVTLFHPTISRNDSENGTGIFMTGTGMPTLAITNAIVVEHSVGISNSTATDISVNGALFFENSSNDFLGNVTATAVITGNPRLDTDGYHLKPASAAIDRALPTAVNLDIDLSERFCGPPDLGADELVGGCTIYLPFTGQSSN